MRAKPRVLFLSHGMRAKAQSQSLGQDVSSPGACTRDGFRGFRLLGIESWASNLRPSSAQTLLGLDIYGWVEGFRASHPGSLGLLISLLLAPCRLRWPAGTARQKEDGIDSNRNSD